jgi:ComF family protein
MGKWTQSLSRSFRGWFNVLLESHCPLCQRSTPEVFCLDCQRQLESEKLANPAQLWSGSLPVFSWGRYAGALKRAIVALKYDRKPEIARCLGNYLGQVWSLASANRAARSQPNIIVVPIPLHRDKLKQRSYNQAELLAEAFCQRTGLSLQRQGLERQRVTDAQFGLSLEQRAENLRGAFRLGCRWHGLPNCSVLLLDDIYTTGATARAAAEAFSEARISVCGIVTVAQALRIHQHPINSQR